jgi:uncharacterized membrane protein YphA (DoxX/SURF4 family)
MKKEFKDVIAIIAGGISVLGAILIVLLLLAKIISVPCFLIWAVIIIAVMVSVAKYIDHSFVNGKWV